MAEQLVPLALIILFMSLAIVGLIGNLTIVLVTIKNKSLHSRCCRLIGYMAFFNFIVCFYVTELRILMLFGVYNISNTLCFYYSFYGIFAMNMQSVLGLFIGLDRLYNVAFPVRYSKVPLSFYKITFSLCIIVSLFVTFSRYTFPSDDVVTAVCLPVTALQGTSLRIWLIFNFVISVLVIVVYGWTHVKCQLLKNSNIHIKTVESVNRILKSLTVVIAFYVCTWFLAISSLFFSDILQIEGEPVNLIRRWSGWLVICNSSLHVFVYFWRTPEYRKAILQLYGCSSKSTANSKIQVSFIPKNQVLII